MQGISLELGDEKLRAAWPDVSENPVMQPNEENWRRRARREAIRFNAGWWLQSFLPGLIGGGVLFAIGVLLARRVGFDVTWVILGIAILMVGWGVASYYLTKAKFLSVTDSLVRLDADLRLHSRLTSASDGVGDWPERKADSRLALRWNWKALLWPPLLAMALVAAAWFVPLPDRMEQALASAGEPPSWKVTQERLDALRKEDIVEKERVEELQQALDALRAQPEDQWFNHQSLEAGDHLEEQTDRGMRALQRDLETGLAALEVARQIEQIQSDALSMALNEKLQQAMQGMEANALPLNKELLSKLKNLDMSKIRKLSESEWKQLCDRMKQGIGTCSGGFCRGEGKGDALLALLLQQSGGGINRGPGSVPLALKDTATDLGTKSVEELRNEDMSRATVGDLLGVQRGEHKVDKDQWAGAQQSGGTGSEGQGGEAVWQQDSTPEEQAVLKKFFR